MSAHFEDRWFHRPEHTADRVPTARQGRDPRYRAQFIDPGTGARKTKTFHHHRDAQRWLTRTETARLLKGRI
ncbi:hypothetical protein [Streptomyces sp. H27-C3]|uniref:hypothetical protein n=1 Tax=Streptomyces sp. H27-C3 TaxID=3046305 RepID=UPI0024BA506D|nr:hypothetical protein [Streptomyces sp. H27-C3]MDJ0466312.1 hypothetical protein [Streptomyces sp. H27-C3]